MTTCLINVPLASFKQRTVYKLLPILSNYLFDVMIPFLGHGKFGEGAVVLRQNVQNYIIL